MSSIHFSGECKLLLFRQKVPPGLDTTSNAIVTTPPKTLTKTYISSQIVAGESIERKLSRRPSNKFLANILLLVGGVICLYRCYPNFGAKVAVAYILSKLAKRGAPSTQSAQPSVL